MNTQELLKGLEGDGISVRKLASYTANTGIYADLHVGRYRGTIGLPPRLIIKGKLKDETRKAYDTYVSLGCLCFIPKEYEAELCSIEGAARHKLRNATITDGFMPLAKYVQFKADFEELREEYFQAKERVLLHWDEIMDAFKAGLDELINSARILKKDRDKFRDAILGQVPSKERYSNSFNMELRVRAFPGQPDISLLDADVGKDIIDSWKNTVVENAIGCISSLVQDVFDVCNNAAARYADKGIINGNTINGLVILGAKVKESNVFRNPLLQEVGDRLDKLASINDVDEQEERIESILVRVYQYCKETGIELKFNPKKGLSKKTLEGMLNLRNSQIKIAV